MKVNIKVDDIFFSCVRYTVTTSKTPSLYNYLVSVKHNLTISCVGVLHCKSILRSIENRLNGALQGIAAIWFQ